MEKLRANSLELRSQAHQEVIDPSSIPVLCGGITVRAGHAVRGRHLITLAPKSSDLGEKLMYRAITLVGGRKSLQQRVLKSLARWLVEIG